MSDDNLTSKDVSEITGEDLENVLDEAHPYSATNIDKQESGRPDIDSAQWDDELDEEDKVDFRALNFEDLTPADRDLYLRFTSLRGQIKEKGAEMVKEDLDNLIGIITERIGSALNDNRKNFLTILYKKAKRNLY